MMLKIRLNFCRNLLKIGHCFLGVSSVVGISLLITGCGEDDLDSELLGNFTLDVPIAYVKRPITTLANPRNATNYQPGGNLWIREYASATAPEKNVTAQYTRGCDDPNQAIEGDVSDPDVSYDGTKIVFAMIIGNYHPEDPNECNDEEHTWSLFEYNIETGETLAVVNSNRPIQVTSQFPKDIQREEGNDIDPAYLPDGRIVFSSDRQIARGPLTLQDYGIAVDKVLPLLDEGGNNSEATMNLHVMPFGGGKNNITQITFNQSHDLNPSVLQNGKIIYSRWEQAYNRNNQFDIYQVNPDGTENELLYGAHSHDTAAGSESVFLHPRQISGSTARIITTLMPSQNTFEGGELVYIDYENFAEIDVPKITSSSSNSTGQTSATGGRIPVTEGNSANGRYTTPYPLWDDTNRALVAWAPCKVIKDGSPEFCTLAKDMTLDPAPAEYGIWILDLDANTQRQMIFPEPGFTITDPVAIIDRVEARNEPVIIPDKVKIAATEKGTIETDILDEDLYDADKGKLVIKSVYDTNNFTALFGNEATAQSQLLPCTQDNATDTPDSLCAVGGQSPDIKAIQGMAATQRPARFLRVIKPAPIADRENDKDLREILGYVPIEPDGSVVVEVPANRPLALEILGVNGNLIQKFQIHTNWIQVKPGETKICNGCHSSHNGQQALNQGATSAETNVNSGFTGTVLASVVADRLIPRFGETMAESRARISCKTDCSSQRLRRDIKFDDVWQDPDGLSPNDEDLHFGTKFSFNLLTSPAPIFGTGNCNDVMDAGCRITYNYETHIQPIWDRERPQFEADGITPIINGIPPNDVQVNYRCTSCHNFIDLADVARVPAGQLDLTTDGPSGDNTLYTSFLELTQDDIAQELDAVSGELGEARRPQFTDETDPITGDRLIDNNALVPLPIPNDLRPGGALALPDGDPLLNYLSADDRSVVPSNNNRNDGRFLRKMTQAPAPVDSCDPTTPCYPGTANHNEMLDPVELRLITEWIDTGGRYTNDITDATPTN